MFGGGQERGLRPGTLPVQLIAGFGLACEIAAKSSSDWQEHGAKLKQQICEMVEQLGGRVIGENTSPFVVNFAIPGINSEAAMVVLKGVVAVSNGSACTSSSYTPSHVLTAMELETDVIKGAIRISWSHFVNELPIDQIKDKLRGLM